MKSGIYSLLGLVVAGALGGTPALAGCWTTSDAEAANVREFQTMLMVATLRCQAAGIDVSAPYNGFVGARRQLLEAANGRLRHHFAGDGGQAGYDRFVTSLANAYGAEDTTPESCGQVAQLAFDAADGSSDLAGVAAGQIGLRTLAGGFCAPERPAVVAATAPPPRAALASAAAASAVSPADKPPLPADVVAAMAVIAAYTRDQAGAPPATAAPVATAMLGPPAAR